MSAMGHVGERGLRIAMISYYLPSESKIGVGYWAHAYANELVDRGHHVTMITPCARPEGARYDVEHVPLHGSMRTFRFAWLMRRIDWSRFDVLHAHGDDYWLWRKGPPAHVRTMHGSCLSEAIHIKGFKERLRMAALGVGELLATVVADRTGCISPETRRWMPWVRDVIPDGVDLTDFRPPDGDRSAHPSILFVGTYERRKRGWLVHKLFREVIHPAIPDAELWMVCDDAPPAPGVRVTGRVDQDELVRLYQQAWVFCLPSTYEGLGIPYIEALACGAVVVATSNPGSRYVLDDGRFGVIASDDELGARLLKLLVDDGLRSEMSVPGRQRATELSLSGTTDTYESWYRALLTIE